MHFIGFIFGHGNSPSLIIVRGGSTPCCRPLIAYQQRQTGLSTAGVCPFILTVDWLGWICYFRKLMPNLFFDIALPQ
ncbi:hypothetical protein B5F35_17315 [Anaeromassilibacillus sp. An200]|nr:hypothetical protein B5F35_17315 [Anaeromassilibacillus sp. An200]